MQLFRHIFELIVRVVGGSFFVDETVKAYRYEDLKKSFTKSHTDESRGHQTTTTARKNQSFCPRQA